jgi:hypothetical protein
MQPFLAMITPLSSGGEPSHPIAPGGPPPEVWPGPGYPAHPIAPGGPPPWVSHPIPPTVWPNPPGQGPGNPPGFWGGVAPPWPTHPIAPGGPPPGIWPSPGHPAHPIAPGGSPPGTWGGAGEPFPTPPIVLPIPPDGSVPERPKLVEWKTAWSATTGWVVVGVPSEDVNIPSPS